MIIGLCGTIGAGKSTAARYYSQCCGFERLSFGDEVRREATARGLSHDSGVLQKLGARLRQEEGIHVWVDCIFSQMRPTGNYVVEGIRYPDDIRGLQHRAGFLLVGIDAPLPLRYERRRLELLKKGIVFSYNDFIFADNKDRFSSEDEGQCTDYCLQQAEEMVINDSTLKKFKRELRDILVCR